MKKRKYQIGIREVLYRTVEVEAESEDDALTQVEIEYDQCQHVLDYNDFLDVSFEVNKGEE